MSTSVRSLNNANAGAHPTDTMLSSVALAKDNQSADGGSPVNPASLYYQQENIDSVRWNVAWPYQLLVVTRNSDGTWSQATIGGRKWVFTLPFGPESLSIGAPSSVNVTATQGGVVEEHNGIVFRPITFSGTTGVLPLKGAAPTFANQNLGQAIFAGTIQNAKRVAASATAMVSRFSPPSNPGNLVTQADLGKDSVFRTSGYYQARLLLKFWEDYHELKKLATSRNLQLAFAIWKDEAVYLTTPVNFTLQRSADSPFEYRYNVALKAWARIKISAPAHVAGNQYAPDIRKPNKLAALLQTIGQARATLSNVRDLIGAVGGDVDHALFEPLREVSLFAKDALGIPLAFVDVGTQTLRNASQTITSFIATKQAYSGFGDTIQAATQQTQDAWKQLAKLGAKLGNSEGSTSSDGSSYGMLNQASQADPANTPFIDPNSYYDLLKRLRPGDMNCPPAIIAAINTERARVRALTRKDFEERRDRVKQLLADFTDAVGAGDATFNATYGRPAPKTGRTPTAGDFRVMYAMNAVLGVFNNLAASNTTNLSRLNPMQFVAALAGQSGINFTISPSKFSVPFMYGQTLEELAARYLGDPDRWLEIATLNNLRSPYVDEEGFDVPLLTSGVGNQITVTSSANLYIGQMVWISATNTARTTRHIVAIRTLSPTQTVLTVDGDADMDRFTVAGQATLHAFLPNTVNSMQSIWIPSDQPSAVPDFGAKSIPGLDTTVQFFQVAGIDLLLTPTNDLVVTPDGDNRLATGITNIVQDSRIKMSVPQGSLLLHPSYGFAVPVGSSLVDLNETELLNAAKTTFSSDPTYTGVEAASVTIAGGAVQVSLGIGVAGVDNVLPIAFNVPS